MATWQPPASLLLCRQEPRLLGTLSFGPGSSICGVGLLAGGLLCAAGRMASGNVQVQAWELLGDGREVQVLPTAAAPNMVWDALQSMVGKAALAGASVCRVGAAPGVCLAAQADVPALGRRAGSAVACKQRRSRAPARGWLTPCAHTLPLPGTQT